MRQCPATRGLAYISVLYQPLKREKYRKLMSVKSGSVRDGSSAQKSLPGEVTAVHILHMESKGYGSGPGARAYISFPEMKQRVHKRKQACRRRMTF